MGRRVLLTCEYTQSTVYIEQNFAHEFSKVCEITIHVTFELTENLNPSVLYEYVHVLYSLRHRTFPELSKTAHSDF
jgi:hypothetical protein